MLIKPRKNKNKDYINISSLFLISLLFLLGFIGPGFWKINSPNFKFVVFKKDVNKVYFKKFAIECIYPYFPNR